MIKKILVLLGGLTVLALIVYVAQSRREAVRPETTPDLVGPVYDPTKPFACGGSMALDLEGKTVDLAEGEAFSAGGDCRLVLRNFAVKAPVAVSAGGDAVVVLEGGTFEGTQAAVSVGGNATLEVRGAALIGSIQRSGEARIVGLPEEEKRDETLDMSRRWGKGACDGVVACYKNAGEFGRISGRVEIDIDGKGAGTNPLYVAGQAPAAVKTCLIENAGKKHLAGYDGPAGKLICEYSGTLTQETEMMTWSPAFLTAEPNQP
ncbi:MAG: hypothetical protein C4523_06365 [Myxococcales bacterium]|nr:MAG: hypothetical protein C4523_06365 [Myxococcales bacterium]